MTTPEDSSSRLYTTAELHERMAQQQEIHENREKELRYQLALIHIEHQDMDYKLLKQETQLYDLRKLVLRLSEQLIARERHESNAGLTEQLAAANRLILSVGGQLWDGVNGTAEQERRCARVNIGSDD